MQVGRSFSSSKPCAWRWCQSAKENPRTCIRWMLLWSSDQLSIMNYLLKSWPSDALIRNLMLSSLLQGARTTQVIETRRWHDVWKADDRTLRFTTLLIICGPRPSGNYIPTHWSTTKPFNSSPSVWVLWCQGDWAHCPLTTQAMN